MKNTVYICTLSNEMQDNIRDLLVFAGITGDDLERAMNSRLSDVLDIIGGDF